MHDQPHSDAAKKKISDAKRGVPLMSKRRRRLFVWGIEAFDCTACENVVARAGFYESKRKTHGISSYCRTCHLATSIRTRDPENARRLGRESMSRQRIADPEKYRERDRIAARKRQRSEKTGRFC